VSKPEQRVAPTPTPSSLDPFSLLHQWFAGSERSWSEGLVALMKDERLSPALGKQAQAAMHLQTMLAEKIAQYLAIVNLPSRSDVQRLEALVGQLADSVARVEAQLVSLRDRPGTQTEDAAAASPVPRVRRTLKPKGQ